MRSYGECDTMSAAATVEAVRLHGTTKRRFAVLPHSIPPMTLAYMAGLFDGEGHISISHRRYPKTAPTRRPYSGLSVRIGIGNKSVAACELFRENFGGCLYRDAQNIRKVGGVHRWALSDLAVEWPLKALLPYLRIKKPQAELALIFRDLQREMKTRRGNGPVAPEDRAEQERMWLLLKNLNRGKPVQSVAW